MTDKVEAEQFKVKGNKALQEGKYQEAVELYGEAIALDPTNHVYFSNRAAAFANLKKYKESLTDASKTVELKPDWPKGYSRKGAALTYLGRLREARSTYQQGLEIDPNNQQLKDGLADVEKKIEVATGAGNTGAQGPTPNPFQDPNLLERLRNHHTTKDYLDDPSFMKILKELQKDPEALLRYVKDQRVMNVLSVLLGVDLKEAAEAQAAAGNGGDPYVDPSPPPTEQTTSEPMETASVEEISDEKAEALKEKELGNAAYKKKEFTEALQHYDRAIELDPDNITFMTNKAAVYFEQQDWEACLKQCESAVEKGRELRSDFKLIAKALARMGNVYYQQKQWKDAIKYFDKSLTEHRNAEVLKKKQIAEKTLKEEEEKAYIDPVKSAEAKDKGNEHFQKGNYPEAIKCYTEAIRRNPADAKLYSNRAFAYTKLAEFHLALKDCDECINKDPQFIKGYLRKGQALIGMKELTRAQQAYQKVLEIDPNNGEAQEGLRKCYAQDNPEERRKRAMQDPEIQQILADPAMQMILKQMQEDPTALREHLQNPEISAKIEKLMSSGLLSVR